MLAAKTCSKLEQTKRETAIQLELRVGRVGEASTILEHAPEFADSVIAGKHSWPDTRLDFGI